ncbi:hypothetical protein ACWKT5_22060 [Streptomyces avermitilis]
MVQAQALFGETRANGFTTLAWRQGARGESRSRFAAIRVRPAGKAVERPIKATASAEQGWWDGILPDCRLLIEWPDDAEAPTEYWLSNLPTDTAISELIRLAKVRRRIEHDYRASPDSRYLSFFLVRCPWPVVAGAHRTSRAGWAVCQVVMVATGSRP